MDSQQAFDLLQAYTPGGAQTLSKQASRFPANYPKVLSHGKDGHVVSLSGSQYIDLISGLGAISVGYSNREVNRAVTEQLAKGVSFSLPILLEAQVSMKLCDLVPNTKMWKFGKNGTDGTVMAVRASRAYTGRDKIMSVGYNGCADAFEIAGTRNAGIPKELANYITKAQYNDIKSFYGLNTKEYACVILEPMAYEYPSQEFLHELRSLCNETGTVLIFDEVVSGGRFNGFVAQSNFGVVPDLTVLSKGIANGFPLCAVGGRRSIMCTFERSDFFASSTFGGEAVSLSACLETLNILEVEIPAMVYKGTQIQNHFNKVFDGLAKCEGYPTRAVFKFPTDDHKAVFMQEMCLQGILLGQCMFIMASHTDYDVQQICTAIEETYSIMQPRWENISKLLLGAKPEPVFRVR